MRERAAGTYRLPAYFSAVLLFDLLPLRMAPPLLFALITYPLIGLHSGCASCLLAFAGTLVLR